jgi:hypothetical protein
MLRVRTWMVEDSRRRERSSAWRAYCWFGDEVVSVVSRRGAANSLARALFALGVEDQPMEVFDEDWGRVVMRHRSVHGAARWTFEEGSAVPLRRARYRAAPEWGSFRGGSAELCEERELADAD